MFPSHLDNLSHLRNEKKIVFKEETVDNKKFTIVSYMIADIELWKLPQARECRGITFNEEGVCVAAPFEKFFRLNENEFTQEHLLTGDFLCQEKIDGSMVCPVLVNDKLVLKTKKSFFSGVALLATKYITKEVESLSRMFLNIGYTPIFEFVSPQNQVVVNYEFCGLTLLAVRHCQTGHYIPYSSLQRYCDFYHIPLVRSYENKSLGELKEEMKVKREFEGYVLIFDSGERIKLKTDWYDSLHGSLTEVSERDIVKMILHETIDDYKAILNERGKSIEFIDHLESFISLQLGHISREVEEIKNEHIALSVKDFALKFSKHPLFSLLIKSFKQQDYDVIEFWERKHLSSFSPTALFKL